MKRSLRQVAEHSPGFVSVQLWCLLVFTSSISNQQEHECNPPLKPPPPTPTPIVGAPARVSVAVLPDRSSPRAHPHPESAGSRRLLRLFYAGRLSFLPFSTEDRQGNARELHIFQEPSATFSLAFTNKSALPGTIILKTKTPLWTHHGAFYPLREACRLIRVMMTLDMFTQEKQQKTLLFPV